MRGIVTLTGAVILSGCACTCCDRTQPSDAPAQAVQQPDQPPQTAQEASVTGTWELQRLDDAEVVPGKRVTLTFGTDGGIGGNAGVNTFGGRYQARPDGSLSISDLVWTERYSDDPPGVWQQERLFLERLGSATAWNVQDGVLTITSPGGRLVLGAARPAP